MKPKLQSESDVEQKFLYKILSGAEPEGLGFTNYDILTKPNIRKIDIDKGKGKKLYYPDYAVVIDGVPSLIVEAKAPGENLKEALREARLYASEVNSLYPKNINPVQFAIASDGSSILASYWDQAEPFSILSDADVSALNSNYAHFVSTVGRHNLASHASSLRNRIKKKARYFKPIHMLGGQSVINESVGENSFGANVSIEYKYLFNPSSRKERDEIINNAYISSKKREAHVSPIDKIIRASIPHHVLDATKVEDTKSPRELATAFANTERLRNEVCLLIGAVGSGKSTFTDYLRLVGLPENLREATKWVNLNLNDAPLSEDYIYSWSIQSIISQIVESHPKVDFAALDTLNIIYKKQLEDLRKGRASLFPEGSERYAEIINDEIMRLQKDEEATLVGMINYVYTTRGRLFVVVLDNCDKRDREAQLLMFQVAAWIKSNFDCMVFLPLRDITYDRYKNEPPLDTVIKDLVFRIDPPLLERVIYERLNFALREIEGQNQTFYYTTPNGIAVECSRREVAIYLRCMISTLFQDQMFKRIITGLAGRNIRRGLEVLLDFCKSGHIGEDELLKVRQSNGDYRLPNHLISKIFLKGKRRYYRDDNSYIKNLFHSNEADDLPNPFTRIALLQWLKNKFRVYGENNTKGFHKLSRILQDLQMRGFSLENVRSEAEDLLLAGCITSESQGKKINDEDLIAIDSSGFIHLDLLRNIDYLSTISEDILFRENQPSKRIADNLVGKGKFQADSRQTALDNSLIVTEYLNSYFQDYFLGSVQLHSELGGDQLVNIDDVLSFVKAKVESDSRYSTTALLEREYPSGMELEAQVISVKNYGIFVEFGLRGVGLVHNTQFGEKADIVRSSCESGDWVIVEILRFNYEHKKFELRLIDF